MHIPKNTDNKRIPCVSRFIGVFYIGGFKVNRVCAGLLVRRKIYLRV